MGDQRSNDGATPRWRPGHEPARDTSRIEAFSDAVIAIMLTLLAIEMLQFDPVLARRVGLINALTQKWPSYFAFLLTFLVIGQIWITHHNLWRYVERVDQGISIINLLLLAFVALTPFGAQLLAESLVDLPRDQACIAAALYSSIMLGQAVAFNLLLWWAHRQCLLHDDVDDDLYRAIARRYLFGPALYAAALLLSFFSPQVGLACYLGVILLYLFPGAGDLPSGRVSAGLVQSG
ncbi:TMEM175 family protein [Sphingomonas sp. BK345]|uniref:TMEM175 family protein n=1 Tax=Sphingomonas sp. BK345 TaxID=2586980 RepID=UPI001859F341|nr:TMEM175 family protein [Sphingomonas sp. BK345]MBB3475744.1 putative membrane protein [Sphingomonas sp. BK345]